MTVTVTYIGHSTVLFDIAGTRLLTDPMFRSGILGGTFARAVEPPPPIDPFPDAILISHPHPDHLDFPSLRQLPKDTLVIAPRGVGRRLRRNGMRSVDELAPGDQTRVGDVEVIATPADHDGRLLPFGPHVDSLGYELRAAGTRVYFAGDTDLFDEMDELAGVDLALLPIGGIGPRLGKGHLDPERVVEAVARIKPRAVVPIHWGTYLRRDLIRRRPKLLTGPAREFRERMAAAAPEVDARVLEPGETFTLASGQ